MLLCCLRALDCREANCKVLIQRQRQKSLLSVGINYLKWHDTHTHTHTHTHTKIINKRKKRLRRRGKDMTTWSNTIAPK